MPQAANVLARMIEDSKVPVETGTELRFVTMPDERPIQEIEPPTSEQVGLVAIAGTMDTIPMVVATMIQAVRPSTRTTLSLIQSSAAPVFTYRQVHAAAVETFMNVGPQSSIAMHFEAQAARAIRECWNSWFADRKELKRVHDQLAAEAASSSSSSGPPPQPALMDVER